MCENNLRLRGEAVLGGVLGTKRSGISAIRNCKKQNFDFRPGKKVIAEKPVFLRLFSGGRGAVSFGARDLKPKNGSLFWHFLYMLLSDKNCRKNLKIESEKSI